MRRRHLFVAAGLLMAVALSAWPSSAGGRSKFTGSGADTSWSVGDAENTWVNVAIFDGTTQTPPGRAQRSRDVFVDVYQAFCDTSTDEFVQREFFTYEPAADATMSISRKLDSASVSGTLDLIGSEYRVSSCDNPKGPDEGTYTDLGEFEVQISVAWSGAGNAIKSSSNYHFNGGPDCKFSSHSASRYRQADAAGTISGDLDLGTLANAEYAELFSTRDMYAEIGNGCYIE